MIVGGVKDGLVTNECLVLNAETGHIRPVAYLNYPVKGCFLCRVSTTKIYKLGGMNEEKSFVQVIEEYNE